MKIKFQADNDLNGHILRALLRFKPEIDFQTALAIGLHRSVPDDQVLALAATAGRVLVSHDLKTMPEHFAAFIINQTSPGLILVSQKLSIKQAAEELLLVWEASEAEEYVNRIYRIT